MRFPKLAKKLVYFFPLKRLILTQDELLKISPFEVVPSNEIILYSVADVPEQEKNSWKSKPFASGIKAPTITPAIHSAKRSKLRFETEGATTVASDRTSSTSTTATLSIGNAVYCPSNSSNRLENQFSYFGEGLSGQQDISHETDHNSAHVKEPLKTKSGLSLPDLPVMPTYSQHYDHSPVFAR